MSWITDVLRFRHDIFIVFIECKIIGNWSSKRAGGDESGHEVLTVWDNAEDHIVQVIEPDGLKRTLKFDYGATININQNILSYQSDTAEEIVVDEKEQSGKGKTRDKLL